MSTKPLQRNNDKITIDRIRDKFGDEFIDMKPNNMNWNEYYGYLYNNYNLGLSGEKTYHDVENDPVLSYLYETKIPEMWLEKRELNVGTAGANYVVEHGYFKIASWLADQGIIPQFWSLIIGAKQGYEDFYIYLNKYFGNNPNNNGIFERLIILSAENGYTNFVHHIPSALISQAITTAMMGENISALEPLTSPSVLRYLGYNYPDVQLRQRFCENLSARVLRDLYDRRELKTIKWIVDNGGDMIFFIKPHDISILEYLLDNGTYPSDKDVLAIADQCNLPALELLSTHNILPSVRDVNWTGSTGCLDVLQFSMNHGIFPTIECLRYASSRGRINILQYLIENNILIPDVSVANYATDGYDFNIQISILELLKQHGIKPDSEGVDDAITKSKWEILRYLLSQNPPILPSQDGINESLNVGKRIVELLLDHKLFPTRDGINESCVYIDVATLDLLEQYGLYPDYRGANIAKEGGEDGPNEEALEWMAKKGIYPSN
jgi:hypothetical protein